MIRDPSLMNSAEWAKRSAFEPATPKKKASPLPSAPPLKSIQGLSYSDASASLRKNIQSSLAKKPEPAKAPGWIVDFSRGQLLKKNISNTKNFRYQLDKQLKGVFNKTSQRDTVNKMIQKKMTRSGLAMRDVKRGLWDLKAQGHITTGQMNRLMGHFRI